jgi:hypothetical protein
MFNILKYTQSKHICQVCFKKIRKKICGFKCMILYENGAALASWTAPSLLCRSYDPCILML